MDILESLGISIRDEVAVSIEIATTEFDSAVTSVHTLNLNWKA
jgi:hypothetical protein